MSATRWATAFHRDYPGCQSVGEAVAEGQPPAGWLGGSQGLRYLPEIRDIDGTTLRDFCTLHVNVTLSSLFKAMTARAYVS